MVIVFCSMGIVGWIYVGIVVDLIECCVDVYFKECCFLVIVFWEMFFNLIYFCNFIGFVEVGVIIVVFILVWYIWFDLLEEMVDFLVVCLFDGFEEDFVFLKCW